MNQQLLILLSTLIISMSCTTHAHQEDTETSAGRSTDQHTHTDLLAPQLHTIASELTTLCSTLLNSLLMDAPHKHQYLNFMHTLTCKHKDVLHKITLNDPDAERCIKLLLSLNQQIKNIYLRLQLITLGTADYDCAFVSTIPDAAAFQSLVLDACTQSMSLFESAWYQPTASVTYNTSSIIRAILAKQYLGNHVSRILHGSAKRLYNALDVDLFIINPLFAEQAVTFFAQQHVKKHTHAEQDLAQQLSTVDTLLDLLPINTNLNPSALHDVNAFFTYKLLIIKEQLMFEKQLLAYTTHQPATASIFIRHHHILTSPSFKELKERLMKSSMINIVYTYMHDVNQFLQDPTPSSTFAFALQSTLRNIENAIKKLSEKRIWKFAQGWVTMYDEKHNPDIALLQEMTDVLSAILEQQPSFSLKKEPWYSSIIQSVKSGSLFSEAGIKNIAQQPDGSVNMDFFSKSLGSKQFPDLKTAATHALLFASPFLIAKAYDYIKHKASNKPEHPAAPEKEVDTDNHEKVLDFASKNPELIKQIAEQNPEIITLIGQNLKKFAQHSQQQGHHLETSTEQSPNNAL